MIYCLTLSIYNMDLPATNSRGVLRDAGAGSIRLVYEGGDDKFAAITASVLNFSLGVPLEHSQEDLYYDDLFTGNENKFKVVLTDQDDTIVWQGFLLPDEYSEPYTVGAFDVDFKATDGLGRLKGKKLPASFYRAKHSVIKTIADCVKQTGLALSIYNDPAVINASGVKRWDQIFVNGAAWANEGDFKDCYEILTDVLTGSGCTIFQKKSSWYVVGINRRAVALRNYDIYNKDGVFAKTKLIYEPSQVLQWFSKPSVTKKPPFKEVKITPGTDVSVSLLPEDIVVQSFEFTGVGQSAPHPIYWSSAWHDVALYDINQQGFPEYVDEDLSIDGIVGFQNLDIASGGGAGWDAEVRQKWFKLDYTPYVKAVNQDINFSVVFTGRFGAISESGFIDNDAFFYDVMVGGELLFSNWDGFARYQECQLEFTNDLRDGGDFTNTHFTATLNVTFKNQTKSGFLEIRVYNVVNPNFGWTSISDLKFSVSKSGNDSCVKRRAIDYTKMLDISMGLGDSVQDLVVGALTVQPAIAASQFDLVPSTVVSDLYDIDNVFVGAAFKIETVNNFNYLTVNQDSIYIQRKGSDFKEFAGMARFIVITGAYYLSLILPDSSTVTTGDDLYVRQGVIGDPQDETLLLAREAWQKSTGAIVTERLACVLADIYHSAYYDSVIAFEGNCEGLVFPGGHYAYDFAEQNRQWIVTRTEIIFGKNESRISILERVDGTIVDYE